MQQSLDDEMMTTTTTVMPTAFILKENEASLTYRDNANKDKPNEQIVWNSNQLKLNDPDQVRAQEYQKTMEL